VQRNCDVLWTVSKANMRTHLARYNKSRSLQRLYRIRAGNTARQLHA